MSTTRADNQPASPINTELDPKAVPDWVFLSIKTSKSSSLKKKRTLPAADERNDNNNEDDEGGCGFTSGDGSDSTGSPHLTESASKKQRKPNHVRKREEREKLLEEIQQLEARAARLRQETGTADRQVTKGKLDLNADLRQALIHQDLVFASSQSAFTGYTHSRVTSPIETFIHLSKDWSQRREFLINMKEMKVDLGHRFLTERTRHMNPMRECSEVSHFESEEGDICSVKVDITPFVGVESMRQVFGAMQHFFENLETSMTEMSGNVTVRENADPAACEAGPEELSVLHHRLVTWEAANVLVEKNAVLFLDSSGLDNDNLDEQFAIAVGDFIDKDELYPYCPEERVRKDVTTVMKLSAHRRKPQQTQGNDNNNNQLVGNGGDEPQGELVVVMTRWFLVRLRRPEFSVSKDQLYRISEDMSSGVDKMIKYMRDGIYPMSGGVGLTELRCVSPIGGDRD